MAKRFTASDKWEDAWFRELPPPAKLFWLFLLDRCNTAGIWKTDYGLASFCIGVPMDADILTHFSGRVEKLNGDKLWIVRFVEFQCGKLHQDSNPHKPIIKALAQHGLLQRVEEGLLYPTGRGYRKGTATVK